MNQSDLLKLLHQVQYDPAAEPPTEQVVFRINYKTIGSLGDFVLFSGRPKSGKSKYISGAIAASISRQEVFSMNIRLPEGKNKVAHFDTEQSKYSHWKMMDLVKRLSNLPALPDTFKSYRCRSVAPAQILALIEFYLKITPECGMIYLDGLLDVITSMNDEKHSNYIKQWLKRITEDYNILLAGVIHRGFSNDKSIGQIGSEGERAAQTVLLIEKNKETQQYILRGEYMRDDDAFDPVAISYNRQMSIWEQVEYIDEATAGPSRAVNLKRRPVEYDKQEHTLNVGRIFNSTMLHSYRSLVERIVEVYAVGQRWAKECVPVLEREQLIFKTDEGFTNIRQAKLLKAE